MEDKKTLLVYYSFEGNCESVAEMILAAAGFDPERLVPDREPPKKGPGKFLKGGGSVVKKEKAVLRALTHEPAAYGRIVLLCPVWASSFPPAMRTFLSDNDLKGKEIYMIGCSSSGNADKMFEKAKKLADITFAGTLSLKDPLKYREEAETAVKDFLKNFKKSIDTVV